MLQRTQVWKMDFHHSHRAPPAPSLDHAVFLDFDGTLVDIAATPELITVPSDLSELLSALAKVLGGAVCIVSGRPLSSLQRFLPGVGIDLVAEHGAVFSHPGFVVTSEHWPSTWGEVVLQAEQNLQGLVVERKENSVAFHYRLNPALEPQLFALAQKLIVLGNHEYELAASKMTFEIKRHNVNKGYAIETLMQRSAYQGRRPVFIADDITDRLGFDAVKRAGGIPLDVDTAFGGETAQVRDWLRGYLTLKVHAA